MATNYKVLGQSAPSATTDTTLYTVPGATEAVASTVFVCNRGSSATTYRIAIRPAGASLANQHYIAYDATIGANDAIAITVGMTLEASDVVTVYAGNGDLSFNLFGSEIS
jgi:glucose-6-phosphate dehydrogenase assembly protein OpcA